MRIIERVGDDVYIYDGRHRGAAQYRRADAWIADKLCKLLIFAIAILALSSLL